VVFRKTFTQVVVGVVLLVATAGQGAHYLLAFVRDDEVRGIQRTHLSEIMAGTIALYAEPAPYSMPATNLFDRALILVAPDTTPDAIDVDLVLAPGGVGVLGRGFSERTPISWASKLFVIHQRSAPEWPMSTATSPPPP
jgi:hypothetical protein